MLTFKTTMAMLALGAVGAALSVAFLLVIPTDVGPSEYSQLADEQLPVLVLVAGAGFAIGSLIAMAWSIVQRAFAPAAPPT